MILCTGNQTQTIRLPQGRGFSNDSTDAVYILFHNWEGKPAMLVMSRRKDQKIVFPTLGITVTLLNVQGNAARLGIDAPREVSILREEIADKFRPAPTQTADQPDPHRLRNVLNSINLYVMVYQKQVEANLPEAAAATFMKMVEFLERQTQLGEVDFRVDQETVAGIDGHVMVVEDDPDQRDLLCSLLAMQGLDVSAHENGRAALSELQGGCTADIVLLDWSMPEFGGEWLVPKIRREFGTGSPKLFVISGADSTEQPSQKGVDAWLAKPVNHDALIARIRTVYPAVC